MRQNKQVWLYYVITYNVTYIWTAICTCNLFELELYTYILTLIFSFSIRFVYIVYSLHFRKRINMVILMIYRCAAHILYTIS